MNLPRPMPPRQRTSARRRRSAFPSLPCRSDCATTRTAASLSTRCCAKCKGVAYCSKDCHVCSPPHPACALSRPQTYPSCPLLLRRVFETCRSLCTLPLSLAPSQCSLTPHIHSSSTPSLIQTRENPPTVGFQTNAWKAGHKRECALGRERACKHARTRARTHARAHARSTA
jgi:hypothetical protein